MRKLSTAITDANGGMHSPTNYRKAMDMLRTHPFTNARLYHLVLTGSDDKADYQWAINKLCKELRANGMPCMWKAAYELDEKKRFHVHVFLLVESKDKVPCSILRFRKDEFLATMLAERNLGFNISQPQNRLHWKNGQPQNYAYVPKKASPKLDDCLIWISYLFKARSKEEVVGQIYTSSTNRGSVKVRPEQQQAPLVEAQQLQVVESQPDNDAPTTNNDKGNAMTTTTQLSASGFKYLGGIYEHCVDKALNVTDIQAYLSRKGIHKPLLAVRNDLDNVFCFTGYAASHPATPLSDVKAYDKAIDRAGAEKAWLPAR